MDVGNLTSGFFAFSKPHMHIWKFLVYAFLNLPGRILSIILLAWEMNAIVQ